MNDKDITSILEFLANEAVPPDSISLWHNIQQHFSVAEQRQPPLISRFRLVNFLPSKFSRKSKLMFALVLALIIAGVFLFAHSRPVNAQEILQQARSAVNNMHANGIFSFEMISETTASTGVPNGITGQVNQSSEIHSQLHTWYQEMDRWRYEMRFVDDNQQYENPQITIADGKSIWSYDPKQNLLQIHDGVIGSLGKRDGPEIYGWLGGLDAILENVDQCYDPTLIGENAIIAGRKTYTIYLGPSKCSSVAAAAFDGPQTIWIDQETYFILRREIKDLNDKAIIYAMTVTDICYNIAIDPGTFILTVPDGTIIYDDRVNP